MKKALENALQEAVEKLLVEHPHAAHVRVQLSRSRQRGHGDYACNVAMPLAGILGHKPHEVARMILQHTHWPEEVEKAVVAGPGFINIHLKQASEAGILSEIVRQAERYGRLERKAGAQRICLEFVSANPTGPMHVGHGRGAVVGDSLARVLAAAGFEVHREYYINDSGAQIGVLADSVWLRMRELSGEEIDFPDSAYPGEYVIDIARNLLNKYELERLRQMPQEERRHLLGMEAVQANMQMIRDDLAALGIGFDLYFSERSLHESGRVVELIEHLKQQGLVYEGVLPPPKGKEVAEYKPTKQLLFRSSEFGDDVDRPLEKQDGTPTYFAADIAYHYDKVQRGFDRLIDIWGADHGGYVKRVQAAMKALTGLEQQPDVLLVQMVNLTREGKPVRMSKRAGTFVTLREVVDEVGADAVRFNFMTRRAESQLDFDLEVARKKNDENPVYYVQYAHARVCAILRRAESEGIAMQPPGTVDVSVLGSHEEQRLVHHLLAFPEVVAKAAQYLEPYRIATYAMKLAADLHAFYHKHRVVHDDATLTQARLLLVRAVGQVIRNALGLLGVQAPERM